MSNITKYITNKMDRNMHNLDNHPIKILKDHIYKFFKDTPKYDNLNKEVSLYENFDCLMISKDHPSRAKTDTYYIDDSYVLRTHTTCHWKELFKTKQNFLVTGDVYRKDSIDKTHYPIFTQMEGVFKVPSNYEPLEYLEELLTKLLEYLFPEVLFEGSDKNIKFDDDYFPFTEPSIEANIVCDGHETEILGSGVIKRDILTIFGVPKTDNYVAFGLGLDRLAMIKFNIPDIRMLWCEDEKFLSQFKDINSVYKPYSKLEDVYNDISFYCDEKDFIKEHWILENEFLEIIRENSEEFISSVKLKDTFHNKKINKVSKMYRLKYQPLLNFNNPSEFRKEVLRVHNNIRKELSKLNIILR